MLALRVSGQQMEKYYVLGIAFTCLIVNLAPYASSSLGHVSSHSQNHIKIYRAFRRMGRGQRDMLVPQHRSRGQAALAYRHTDLLDRTFCRRGGGGLSRHRWLPGFIRGVPLSL